MRTSRTIFGLLLLALFTPACAQTMYRWVDKAGQVHYSDTPPAIDVKEVKEKKIGTASYVELGPSYSMRKAQRDFPVTFYRDTECTGACKEAHSLLEKRGIPFKEVTLKTEEDMAGFKRTFNVERAQIPAVTVGGQKQIGFESETWSRLLDAAGYPSSAPAGAASNPNPAAPASPPSAGQR